MQPLRTLVAITIAFLLQLPGGPHSDARAQGAGYLPEGSYRESCSNISVRSKQGRGLVLHASCTDRHGNWQSSSLDLPCQRVANDNGSLKCEVAGGDPGGAYLPPVPDGSYRESCADMYVRNDRAGNPVLFANCVDRAGRNAQSTLYLPCQGNVVNDDGRLICAGQGHGGPAVVPGRPQLPGGSYRDSCVDLVVQDQPGRRPVLYGSCSDRNGRFRQSSLYLPCYGSVVNDDGRLRCND